MKEETELSQEERLEKYRQDELEKDSEKLRNLQGFIIPVISLIMIIIGGSLIERAIQFSFFHLLGVILNLSGFYIWYKFGRP